MRTAPLGNKASTDSDSCILYINDCGKGYVSHTDSKYRLFVL